MNCPQCQSVISPGSAYCGHCGTLITAQRRPGDQTAAGYNAVMPPARFDHNRLSPADKIVGGCTLVAMISIWLPWFSISWGNSTFEPAGSASISGTAGHGWLWLEFFLAIALLGYLAARAAWDRLPVTMPAAHAPLLVAGTSLQLLLVLIAFVDIPYSNDGVGLDWGAFIALLAALGAAGPVAAPAIRGYLDRRRVSGGPGY
jgi:hypothetical protein